MSLISVVEATEKTLSSLEGISETESIPLEAAAGRVLAASLCADRSYPPYDRCMMDGITFSSASTTKVFKLLGTLHAGEQPPVKAEMEEGTAWRINTGGTVPASCDTVVPVEELIFKVETVQFKEGYVPEAGRFIHRCGSDVVAGEEVLKKGHVMDSAALSIAASIGAATLEVFRPLKVFILTTGKEALPVTADPTDYQIRQSHPMALSGALHALGVTDKTFMHLPDHFNEMHSLLKEAVPNYDLIITCGAISKGSSDYLRPIFTDFYGEPTFHGVAQRPGKPMAYWASKESLPPVFALPGNALSTLVTFHRYVAPAIRKMMHQRPLHPLMVECPAGLPEFHLTRFLPVSLKGQSVRLHNSRNSGDFSSLSGTEGFIQFPDGHSPKSSITVPFYPWL